MSNNIWQGAKVRLRAMEPEDWEALHAFDMSDTEGARLGWYIPFPRSAEQAKQWAAHQEPPAPDDDRRRLVIQNLEGVVVGMLNITSADRRNGVFEYGIALGHPYRRQGYGSDAIRLILNYFFRELRYQKALVTVYAFNAASLRLHEKLGFQHEGRMRRMIFTRGTHHDELILGMLAEEFESE